MTVCVASNVTMPTAISIICGIRNTPIRASMKVEGTFAIPRSRPSSAASVLVAVSA